MRYVGRVKPYKANREVKAAMEHSVAQHSAVYPGEGFVGDGLHEMLLGDVGFVVPPMVQK